MIKLISQAKINLFLHIGSINHDNELHNISSLMIPISLYDTLTVTPSPSFSVSVSGINEDIPSHKNILTKAHNLMKKEVKEVPNFTVTIDKKIPTGGGLGGGSGNAAAYLSFLNTQIKTPLSDDTLITLAHKVGSDVPFFLGQAPALISNTGETIEKVSLTALPKYLLLLIPDLTINTAEAYRLLDKKRLTSKRDLTINTDQVEEVCSLESWKQLIKNDFQSILTDIYPVFTQLMDDALYAHACCSFVTGSGSTVVAMFTSEKQRTQAAVVLRNSGVRIVSTDLLF